MPFAELGAFESTSDVQRFIIRDLSNIFISDIFISDIFISDLSDILETFPSLSTSLVS